MQITTSLTTTTLNGEETIVKTFQGTLQTQGGLTLLTYEDPELGLTRLFYTEDSLRLVRKGRFSTQMVFLPHGVTHSDYHTPNGTFDLEVHTALLRCTTTPDGGQFAVHYNLFLSGEEVAKNKLTIDYQS